MKKLLIAMAMMSAMAMAQTSTSTDQSTSNSSSTPQASSTQSSTSTDTSAQSSDTSATHKDHAKMSSDSSALPQSDKAKSGGKDKTVTGCLHKDGDNLWLKTRTTKYHVMASQDLSAHDGHEVKVTGTASKAPMPGSSDTKKINHLEASNVEMVADQCKMGTKSMKMKGDQMEKKDTEKK